MKKKVSTLIISIILLTSFFWLGIKFMYREKIPKRKIDSSYSMPVDREQSRLIDYSVYNRLLRTYVADGLIDYIDWRENDFAVFDRYVRGLKYVDLNNLNARERKTFWINTYNALTIYAVLRRIPANRLLARSFSVRAIPGFFDKVEYVVAGESLTLNDIENQKLRAGFRDPRIHFAIVCASTSCPEIQNTVFTPDTLDMQLDEVSQLFMRDGVRTRLDKEKRILYLSEIFRWFEEDFVNDAGPVLGFVKKYISKNDAAYLTNNSVTVKYLFYNWLVNMQK